MVVLEFVEVVPRYFQVHLAEVEGHYSLVLLGDQVFSHCHKTLEKPLLVHDFVLDVYSDVGLAIGVGTVFSVVFESTVEHDFVRGVLFLVDKEVEIVHDVLLELYHSFEVLSVQLEL